jgi:cysteinyl-tRNA synthetase
VQEAEAQWSMLTTWAGEMAHALARGPRAAWTACAVRAADADGPWQRSSAAFERYAATACPAALTPGCARRLAATRAAVDAALRSDFAYATAWREIVALATAARAETLADIEQSRLPTPDAVAAHRFVGETCALFGLPALAGAGEAGSGGATGRPAGGNDAAIEALVAMRAAVRAAAATRKTAGDAQALRATLAVCDAIRDTTLPALGYELRDGASGPVLVRRHPVE